MGAAHALRDPCRRTYVGDADQGVSGDGSRGDVRPDRPVRPRRRRGTAVRAAGPLPVAGTAHRGDAPTTGVSGPTPSPGYGRSPAGGDPAADGVRDADPVTSPHTVPSAVRRRPARPR